MIRAFIAVPVPVDVTRAAETARARCSSIEKALRWVAPERIHLTLKFLGDVDMARVAAVNALLEDAASARPFALTAGGLGVFPSVKRPRVLWMGVTGETARLIDFARLIDARLADLGFEPEKRRFRAHLTLGRFKGKTDPKRLTDVLVSAAGNEGVAFTADRVILFQSELKPTGAVHTPLAAYPLTAGSV